jgi:uncharacterized protein YoxC
MGIKKQILEEVNELRKSINYLIKENEELKKQVNTFSDKNQEKIKKYEMMMDYLNDIKVSVSNVRTIVEKNGSMVVEVSYSIPKQIVYFDDENNVILNKTFKAINMLNLISFEDMKRISDKIDEAKMKNGG